MSHPIFTMQLADDRRAELRAAAHRYRALTRIGPTAPPGTPAFGDWASALGHLVARHGIDRVEVQVADLCRTASLHGVASTATTILADRQQPEVARERALGRVLTALAMWEPSHQSSSDAA